MRCGNVSLEFIEYAMMITRIFLADPIAHLLERNTSPTCYVFSSFDCNKQRLRAANTQHAKPNHVRGALGLGEEGPQGNNIAACGSTSAGVVSREELTVNRRFATPAVKKRVEVADREITFIKRHCRNTSVRIPYLSTSEKTSQTIETMRLGHDSRCSWVEREEIALPSGVS
jgi:hypothetical protein